MIYRICLLISLLAIPAAANTLTTEQMHFFEAEVRPLLANKCIKCHGAKKQKADLRLDSLDAMLKGGESGTAIVPGDPAKSLLIDAINYREIEMPPKEPLDARSIQVLTRWVKMGAPWPNTAPIREAGKRFTEKDRQWWAVQPVTDPAVPDTMSEWARNSIDQFIAKKLADANLKPAREADRHELVRRAYFDLHGLPPTPEQQQAFINDDRPDAWQRLIRELLASPRYGERWAQHWLDVVRYAESDGYREDRFRPGASAFRDYVIRSMNNDKPYNQFVREHLAGDEINPDDPDVFIGAAYLRHGIYEWNQRNARMHWDLIVNELTRVTGEAFLGVGIGCAQCHDHKFDPILQKDYFGLQAFVSSVAWPMDRPLATGDRVRAYRKQMTEWEEATKSVREEIDKMTKPSLDGKVRGIVKQFPEDIQAIYYKPEAEKTTYEKQLSYLVQRQVDRSVKGFNAEKSWKSKPEKLARYQELAAELKKFDSMKPASLPSAFIGTDIGPDPAPTYLLTRTTKEAMEPDYLTILGSKPPAIEPTETTTGRRTALADWIADKDNPLSTRVIVNRIWQRHFGVGIVPTPNDFGTLGEPPSHPELLDWLTSRFLEGGWKLKSLHELIMNSAAYRQTAHREPTSLEAQADPTNRLLWRFRPQRLDAEQTRDAMLAVSGELKQRTGGSSVSGTSPYRSVFVKKLRNNPDEMLKGFDAPLGFESAPDRIATTTPIQSLLLVNGDWTLARSKAFARRLLAGKSALSPNDIRTAFQLAYSRDASESEVAEAIAFINYQARSAGTLVKQDKYPNETGLRPITQHFGSVKDVPLGDRSLWIQPDSRFERLHVQQSQEWGNEFTVEAVSILDRIYPDGTVNTLLSRWNGNLQTAGWNIGVTSTKSRVQPRNLLLQIVGRTAKGNLKHGIVASDLRYPLNKPVYFGIAISATPSEEDPTMGVVRFYMKDLSDPTAEVQTATVKTDVIRDFQNPAFKIIAGGRDGLSHQWDGQLARLTISKGALPADQLLIGKESTKATRILDWTFNDNKGEHNPPAPQTAWVQQSQGDRPSNASPKMLSAVTDFCHALFNTNEFLYLH